jgi:hypothetical protein
MISQKNNSRKIKNNYSGNCIHAHKKMENNYSGIYFSNHSGVKNPADSGGCGVVKIHSTPPATKVKPERSGQ